ncbi:uncharacterized protein LOC123906690 [Trifolium pratense]|uniref:Uncharacterized protein n=1 Tax=Trifolium pratense TaxID=57577 RepID=A0ACB0L7G7_TRIPR|nr:uncharacterized protein LOC123906690 [Trifolium pratense]CAJ2665231.1 unnamed protein product [Trifolium pratense]
MGNYISCSLSAGGGNKQWRGIKVIFPCGEIRKIEEAVTAAELMVEMPSFFVVNTRSLQIGRRFCALNADEELEYGNVYVMIPMKKLNSAVTAADMGTLLLTAKRVSAKGNKILPTAESILEMESQPKLNLDDIDQELSMHRLSLCSSRSKKPLLETIAEETVC